MNRSGQSSKRLARTAALWFAVNRKIMIASFRRLIKDTDSAMGSVLSQAPNKKKPKAKRPRK